MASLLGIFDGIQGDVMMGMGQIEGRRENLAVLRIPILGGALILTHSHMAIETTWNSETWRSSCGSEGGRPTI